jgi:hypothetical protein
MFLKRLNEEILPPNLVARKPFRRNEEIDQSCMSYRQVTLSTGGALRATYSSVYACKW